MLKIFKHITKESGSKRFSDRGVYETVALGLLLAGIATMMTVAGSVGQKISGHVRVKNAKNDLAAIGTLSGLGMQYYVATGSAPTINNLVSAGYLPNTSAVCSSCNGGQGAYVTPAGTNVTLGSPTAPGAMIGVNVRVPQSQSPVATMYKNALSGSNMTAGTGGTYQISWNNPISGSLSGKYVQLNPPGGASQTVYGPLSTNGNTLSTGAINTNGQPIYSGAINTNGQPIYAPGRQLLNYVVSGPSNYLTYGSYWLSGYTTFSYSGNPSTMAIYAQPCSSYGCGPLTWYGSGSSISCKTAAGRGNWQNCPAWWNTPYGSVWGSLY